MGITLSRRLEAIISLVPEGSRVCDVGCDHALVDIALLQRGQAVSALAMDVAEGPLGKAEENIALAGMEERCEVRKSDGLQAYQEGEADTLIIAGMGGMLMQEILEEGSGKAESFKTLILSPHRQEWLVREWLASRRIGIRKEKLIFEDGKYYPVILAEPGKESEGPDWESLSEKTLALEEEQCREAGIHKERTAALLSDPDFQREAEAKFGPVLIRTRDEVLISLLKKRLAKDLEIFRGLGEGARERKEELLMETGMMQVLLFICVFLR